MYKYYTKRLAAGRVNYSLETKRPHHPGGKLVPFHRGPLKTNSFVKNLKSSRTIFFLGMEYNKT
jgi:hypothetical protein